MIIRKILEMIRFSHTLFALPFAMLSALMGWYVNYHPLPSESSYSVEFPFRWLDLIGILFCMVFARSAAMSFNRVADRHLDAVNPRTSGRHLPAGILSVQSVILFTVICCVCFIGTTILFLPHNPLPLICSIPVLTFIMGYSYGKRITVLVHFWLGASLMLAPIAAWVVVRGEAIWQKLIHMGSLTPEMLLSETPPVILGVAVMFWVAGFDIIYATQDYEHDRQSGLFSIPSWLGIPGALRMAGVCHLIMFILLSCLPLLFSGFGSLWYMGMVLIGILLLVEHMSVCPHDLRLLNVSFFYMNVFISTGLLILGSAQMWLLWR